MRFDMAQPPEDRLPALPHPNPGVVGGAVAIRQAGMLQTQVLTREVAVSADDVEIDLRQIWRTLVKHRWLLLDRNRRSCPVSWSCCCCCCY